MQPYYLLDTLFLRLPYWNTFEEKRIMLEVTANEILQACKTVYPDLSVEGLGYHDYCMKDDLEVAATTLADFYYPTREKFAIECFKRKVSCIDKLSRLLANVHTMSHHGGLMKLLPPWEIVDLFKQCNPKYIMNDSDLSVYNNLEEEVVVYRGGLIIDGNEDFITWGVSWTTSRDVAKWFACRYSKLSEDAIPAVCKGRISKEFIYAYFNSRQEEEIVCDPSEILDYEWEYILGAKQAVKG